MAVRDRNLFAWQAYVITMAFVSVGLLLGMFFLWSSYSALSTRYEAQATSLANANSQFTTSDGRVDRLLSMMGQGNYTDEELSTMAAQYATDERLSGVEKEFEAQMKLFPPGQASEKNLIKLPEFLLGILRSRNEQIDRARERENQMQQELTQTVQRETAARVDAQTKQKQAEADLDAQRQSHAAAIARLNAEKEDALKKYTTYEQDYNKKMAVLANDNRRLVAENAQQSETIQVQADKINQWENPDFAAPQGKIVRVTDGGTKVWINLGSADGLRTGVPFSVIDESAVNITDATPKANLIVTRIVGEHLCQGDVSDSRGQVLTEDRVYSPAWRPGRTVGFALVGLMDYNGDGKDDIEQVRQMIKLAGGQIDAEMDTKGQRIDGPAGLSPNTSFMVQGTDLTIPPNATPELRDELLKRAAQYAKFLAEARQNGVILISLDKLMGYLKTESSNRTVPLGNRIKADDFKIKAESNPPVSRGSVSEIFQQRQPK